MMMSKLRCLAAILLGAVSISAVQAQDFRPVTDAMLKKPDAADWLMLNRTYDEQRFSPLNQINIKNVHQMQLAFGFS